MDLSIIALSAGIAVVFTFRAQREIKRIKQLRVFGIRALGIVTSHKVRIGRFFTTRPLIQYATQQGQTVEAEGRIGTAIPWRRKGQQFTVLYDDQKPESFMLDDETDEAGPYVGVVIVWLVVLATVVAKWQST